MHDNLLCVNDDFTMLTTIKHCSLIIGRQLAPIAVLIAKTMMELWSKLSPRKMVSF